MNLSVTLAEVPGTAPGGPDLDSLHRWLAVDGDLFTAVRLVHRPAPADSRSGAQELIAPLAELGTPAVQGLPLAIAGWIEQERADLNVSYRCADGTEMVAKLSWTQNPEQLLRQVIEAAATTDAQARAGWPG